VEHKAHATTTILAGTFQLPVLVFGIVEVRRLKRELEALEEFMRQTGLREPGKAVALPRVSRLLDALASGNHLNLLQPADRKQLEAFLKQVEHSAPQLHISFATDPSSAFTAKVVSWLRANIASDVLLDIGLQPTIAAGCVVRTTNKIFDMSLRERFTDVHDLLLESLESGGVQAYTEQPTMAATQDGASVIATSQSTAPQSAVQIPGATA
jgi:F0F1-type ATP synthase delta subunit